MIIWEIVNNNHHKKKIDREIGKIQVKNPKNGIIK